MNHEYFCQNINRITNFGTWGMGNGEEEAEGQGAGRKGDQEKLPLSPYSLLLS